MGYLTSSALTADIEAISFWERPGEVAMQVHLDLASDRMIVQLEYRGVPRGVVFGSYLTTKDDVRFMLSKAVEKLKEDVAERMAMLDRPSPPWLRQAMDSLRRWTVYEDGALERIERLLKETQVAEMPPLVVHYRLSGVPKLLWQKSGRELCFEVLGRDSFRYTRRALGQSPESGRVETSSAVQLRDLMLWLRDG